MNRYRSGAALVAALSLSCVDPSKPEPQHPPEDSSAPVTVDPDADGDGSPESVDCDDTDPGIWPGAPETCDGRDEDCDGDIDEQPVDGTQLWRDGDGDGIGRADDGMVACPGPDTVGWVDRTGDCDDANPAVYPGAPEHCDGVDEDCDDRVDEDPVDAADWFNDADGDGRGAGAPVTACEAPPNHELQDGDCDDTDPNRRPGLPEVCDPSQGKDDDCDGLVDCEDSECAEDAKCEESDCSDGLDSDLDGATDCMDDDCWGEQTCHASELHIHGGELAHQVFASGFVVSSWQVRSMTGVAMRTLSGRTTSSCAFVVPEVHATATTVSRTLHPPTRSGTVESGCGFNPLLTFPPALGQAHTGPGFPLGWGIWRPSTAPWTVTGSFTTSAGIARAMYSERALFSSGTSGGGSWRSYALGGSVVGFPPTAPLTAYHRWW